MQDQPSFQAGLFRAGKESAGKRPKASPARESVLKYPLPGELKNCCSPKPPLLGEVARRSRDGGVSGLCHAAILCFFLRLEAQPKAATPQALRASSPSRGAKKLLWPKTLREGSPKPPLLGEVARRSRDGGVSGLCHGVILCFFLRLEAQPKAATPQALRASSPSSGAKRIAVAQNPYRQGR